MPITKLHITAHTPVGVFSGYADTDGTEAATNELAESLQTEPAGDLTLLSGIGDGVEQSVHLPAAVLQHSVLILTKQEGAQ